MPSNMYYDAEYADQLKEQGINVITSCEGCYTPNDFIAQHGTEFGLFYLVRVDVAEEILYTIRQTTPESKVFFHAPDVYFLRESREAKLQGDEQRLQQAMKTKKRELELMRRVDFTVVISENEKKTAQGVSPRDPHGRLLRPVCADCREDCPILRPKGYLFLRRIRTSSQYGCRTLVFQGNLATDPCPAS